MANVSMRQVVKNYGSVRAIHGIDIDIGDGEFMALVGPSGCGKSTLLRMIAGLEEITDGDIEIGGTIVNDLPPKQRDIAMVFQNYALYPHMTVSENMAFSLKLAGASAEVRKERVAAAAEILGLGELLERYPRQLSGGQRQRVAMGRAIVRDPKVFLFDEPLSNLDAKLRVAMRAEIKQLHQKLKTTTVFVTHDQVEAMTMADRIVVMNGGRVEQIGTPLELYDEPRNLFVATFIGSPAMNLLEGEVAGGTFRLADGTELALPVADAGTGPATCGIRPEHILIDPEGLEASVVVLEPTGSETQVILKLGNETLTGLFRERIRARPGETIRIALPPASLHLFDKATGLRLARPDHEGTFPT